MYIKIKKKQFFQYEEAVDCLKNIAEIIEEAAETDSHGNAAYKADKPLIRIQEELALSGYMKFNHDRTIPGFEKMETNGEVKIPWECALRKDA